MCPECGREPGGRDARFCGHCGANLTDADARRPPHAGSHARAWTFEERTGGASLTRGRVLTTLALLAVASVAGVVLLRSDGEPPGGATGSPPAGPSPATHIATETASGPLRLRTASCPIGEDGCLRWRLSGRDPETRFLGPAEFGEYGYVGVATGDRGFVRAFRLSSGEETWTWAHDAPVRSAPVVGDGIVAVATGHRQGPDTVQALEALSGRTRWKTQLEGRVDGPLAVLEGVVFVPIGDGVAALDVATGDRVAGYPATGAVSGSVLGRSGLVHYGHEGGIQTIDRAQPGGGWSVPAARSFVAPTAARFGVGGVVVAAHADGRLAAYRGRNGELLWERRDLHVPDLPPLVEDHFLVALREGRFVMLHPWSGRSEPGLGGEDEVPERAGTGTPVVGTPISWRLSGLTAYVVEEEEIVAYNVRRGGTRLWSHPFARHDTEAPGAPVLSLDLVMVAVPGELIALSR